MAGTTWNTFVPGTRIKSSEVNQNFDWIEGSLLPMVGGVAANETYDLGTSSAAWRHTYTKHVILNGDMYFMKHTAGLFKTYFWMPNTNTVRAVIEGATALEVASTHCAIPATNKWYLDGGSDTYIVEGATNTVAIYSGGIKAFQTLYGDNCAIYGQNLLIDSLKGLYFDGGGDTRIVEAGANDLYIMAGNVTIARAIYLGSTDASQFYVPVNLAVRSGMQLAIDGGGDTYIYEPLANNMRVVVGNTVFLDISATAVSCGFPQGAAIGTTKRLYFDYGAGSDTYISEASANKIEIICGGTTITTYDNSAGQTFVVDVTIDDAYALKFGTRARIKFDSATSYFRLQNDYASVTTSVYLRDQALSSKYIYCNYMEFCSVTSWTAASGETHRVTYHNGQTLRFILKGGSSYMDYLMSEFYFTPYTYNGGSNTSDGRVDLGNGNSYDWKNIYYHSLNAHCFDTVKKDITSSLPASLFDSLPKTGRFRSHVQKDSDPKKYGFYVEASDADAKPYINADSEGNKSISLHGLIAQLTECVKNLDARVAALEKV